MKKNFFYKKADFSVLDLTPLNGISNLSIKELIKTYTEKEVITMENIDMATFHHVYKIQLEDREILFLKIPKFKNFKYSLLWEKYIYSNLLKESNIALKVLAFNFHSPIPFILTSQAKGICLRNLDIDSENFSEIILDLGRKTAEYHNLKISEATGFGCIDTEFLNKKNQIRGLCDSWKDYIDLNLEDHLNLAKDYKAIKPEELKAIKELFKKNSEALDFQSNMCLLHGDLASHNIFVENHKITGIIDWEDGLLGDPLFDISMFASFYRMEEFLDFFIEGYGEIRNIEKDNLFYIKFWLYYLRISIAKGVLRFKLGYDRPGQSKASDKIKRAIKNLKYIMKDSSYVS